MTVAEDTRGEKVAIKCMKVLGASALPMLRRTRVLERDPACRIVLCKSAPGGEIELVGFLQLTEIAFEPRTFGKQAKDPVLVEDIHVIAPNHVINWRELAAVADEGGRQARDGVSHCAPRHGMGTVTAKPAR